MIVMKFLVFCLNWLCAASSSKSNASPLPLSAQNKNTIHNSDHMTHYVSLPFNKKLNLLRSHSLSCEWPDLNQEHWCLHCGKKFNGHSVRVWQDESGRLWLECGTPGCDGSPIDWAPEPWWDGPSERKTRKKKGAKAKRKKSKSPPPSDDDVPF